MGKKQRSSNNNVKAPAAPQPKKGSVAANNSGTTTKDMRSTSTATTNKNNGSGNIVALVIQIVLAVIKVVLVALLASPFWFLTHSLSVVYGRPPKLVYWSQAVRFLRYTWTTTSTSVPLPLADRIRLTSTILVHTLTSPVMGFCWLLDEILYGSKLRSISVVEPLFVVSAYRSASTQMARCLAASEASHFVAPNSLMCAWPYLWLWYLVSWIVGDLKDPDSTNQEDASGLSKEEIKGYLNKSFTPESLARHENDPFQLDTFDAPFLSSHLNGLAWQLGPQVIVQEFNYAQYIPENKHLFEHNMVECMDRMARKTMLFYNCNITNANSTLLVKGHFLSSCPALEQKYPGAKFLTVLRDPVSRLQSGINFLAVNPTIWQGKPNWAWLAKALTETEATYCEKELQWFGSNSEGGADNNDNRLAVRFDSFVDPKGFQRTMKKIYTWMGEDKVPSDVVPPQSRHNSTSHQKQYKVNVTLQQLGVDETAYTERLADYIGWMKQIEK